MNYITLFHEAFEEAERLTKSTGRSVEVKAVNCPCDYDPMCGKCAASGVYYELVYASCSHPVGDGDEDEDICEVDFCREREVAQVFPLESPALKSRWEVQSELEAELEAFA